MSAELIKLLKLISIQGVDAKVPVNVHFGVVETENPLTIRIDQKKILDKDFLVLSRNVTDYEVDMVVNHQTEKMSGGAKDPSFTSHVHQYKGTKKFKVLNALKAQEKVALISVAGGQKYLVIDRVV